MKLTVCIGSSCHLKGSRYIVEKFQQLIDEYNLSEKVVMAGAFCTGNCQQGVCVTLDDSFYSVTPDTAEDFFKTRIASVIK